MGLTLPREDILAGIELVRRLPFWFRRPMNLEQARRTLRERLERREASSLARAAVYRVQARPYRALLDRAGCQYGDLERLVRRDGVDSALRDLFAHGVYLTADEFEGPRPVIRGNAMIAVDPGQLRNPTERRPPRHTDAGKILHLHARRTGPRPAAPARAPVSAASANE
jgi:hypothetical protein